MIAIVAGGERLGKLGDSKEVHELEVQGLNFRMAL